MFWITNKPLSIVLKVQFVVTFIIASGIWVVLGRYVAMSALMGGLICAVPSYLFALMVSRHRGYVAGDAIRVVLRAEAIKIITTLLLFWAVFKFYENVNAIAVMVTFMLVVLTHSFVLLISEEIKK